MYLLLSDKMSTLHKLVSKVAASKERVTYFLGWLYLECMVNLSLDLFKCLPSTRRTMPSVRSGNLKLVASYFDRHHVIKLNYL